MNSYARGATWWFVPTFLSMGCATAGRSAFGTTTPDIASIADDGAGGSAADDPSMSGPVLDRAAYVRAVLHRSRSIESARQAWRAAIARVRESGAFEDPMVTLEVAPLSIGSSSARLGWTGMVSQRLPWPGKLSLEETVSRAEADAQRCDYEAARRELALTASLLYDDYFVAVRSIEINAHHVELMRSMHAAAVAQFEAGRASAQDPLQAEFELTHMEHDTVILASRRDVTVAQMNELLHRDPELPLPPPPKDLPRGRSGGRRRARSASRAKRSTVDPTSQARGSTRAPRRRRAERAERESYPDVTVSTSYNSMWDTPEHRWMVGLSFNLPVQAGRRRGAVDEANAMRAQYEADAARMSDMARTQVVVAAQAARGGRARPAHLRGAAPPDRSPASRRGPRGVRRVASALRLRDRRGEEPARRRARSADGAGRLRPATRGARSRARTHARPRRKGGRTMSRPDRNAARSRLVSIALVLSLAVLALVLHRPLIAWFSGESMAGSASPSVTVDASRPSRVGTPGRSAMGEAAPWEVARPRLATAGRDRPLHVLDASVRQGGRARQVPHLRHGSHPRHQGAAAGGRRHDRRRAPPAHRRAHRARSSSRRCARTSASSVTSPTTSRRSRTST